MLQTLKSSKPKFTTGGFGGSVVCQDKVVLRQGKRVKNEQN
jgi:hypothetical protein